MDLILVNWTIYILKIINKWKITWQDDSEVTDPPVTELFGDVILLVGLTLTMSRSIPSVYAATWATLNIHLKLKYQSDSKITNDRLLLFYIP